MKDKITFWSWCACVIQSDISSLQCIFIDKCLICNSWNWLQLCKNRFWNWAKKQQLLVVEDCYQGHFHFHKSFWWRTEMLPKLLGLSNWKAKWQKVNQWKILNMYWLTYLIFLESEERAFTFKSSTKYLVSKYLLELYQEHFAVHIYYSWVLIYI